jgi:hypothetical protein
MALGNAGREGRALRVMVMIAFVIVLVTDVGYVLLIRTQQPYPPDAFTVPFVAAFLALMAAMLGVSLLDSGPIVRLRPALRAGAAAGLLVLGVLALFSIGLPLVVAGALATGAALRSLVGRRRTAVVAEFIAAVLVLVVLVSGFEVTERLIVCPAIGESGGGGPGFVTGGYHWECVNGQLNMHSGFGNSGTTTVGPNGNVTTASP